MHGVYKYEYEGQVIYIGKTTSSFSDRIVRHSYEEKFKPYLDKAVIYTCFVEDEYEADFFETALIAEYQPVLNVAKKKITTSRVHVDVEWEPYDPKRRKRLNTREYNEKKSRRIQILTFDSLVDRMDAYAKKRGVSRAEVFEVALEKFLSDLGE